jgi:hypothetical protein
MGGSSVSHAYSAVTANPKPSEGGHSQEIVPGLKAPTVGWLISPDLNEVRVQHQTTGCNVRPGPERSEGGHSQKIVPGLEASNYRLQRAART